MTIAYDGTNYNGWQIQPKGTTIQQVVQNALKTITGEDIKVLASGRTDAGVHAQGQVICFDTDSTIPPKNFYKALNVALPNDIRALDSEGVEKEFSPIKSAKKKTYKYTTYLSPTENPLRERYALCISEKLDVNLMQIASQLFIGEHDFKSFCSSKSGAKTTVRTIYDLSVEQRGDEITFTVTGNGFLYNMVRIIVGTLLKIGKGKMTENELVEMINGGGRALGGKTIPAKGLCLQKVEY